MAEMKTKPTNESVEGFLNKISDEERRADCFQVAKIMEEVTGEKPKMWGPSIVGFGSYHYKYDSGREGDWLGTGFSPRKKNLTLYIKRLSDVHVPTLKKLIKVSINDLREYTKSKNKS